MPTAQPCCLSVKALAAVSSPRCGCAAGLPGFDGSGTGAALIVGADAGGLAAGGTFAQPSTALVTGSAVASGTRCPGLLTSAAPRFALPAPNPRSRPIEPHAFSDAARIRHVIHRRDRRSQKVPRLQVGQSRRQYGRFLRSGEKRPRVLVCLSSSGVVRKEEGESGVGSTGRADRIAEEIGASVCVGAAEPAKYGPGACVIVPALRAGSRAALSRADLASRMMTVTATMPRRAHIIADPTGPYASRDPGPDCAVEPGGADGAAVAAEGLSNRIRSCRGWCVTALFELAEADAGVVASNEVVAAIAAREKGPDLLTRRYCAAALGCIGTPGALTALRKWLASEDDMTRANALGGLARAGDNGARQSLLDVLAHGSADARWSAVLTLGLMGRTSIDLAALKAAMSDRSKYVREAAESAINDINAVIPGVGRESESTPRPIGPQQEAVQEIIGRASGSGSFRVSPNLLPSLINELASRGEDAVSACADAMSGSGLSSEAYRWLTWAIGHVDDPDATESLFNMALRDRPEAEMMIQCLRSLARDSGGRDDILALLEQVGPDLIEHPKRVPLLHDVSAGLLAFTYLPGGIQPDDLLQIGKYLMNHLDAAMRWEKRFHTERECGALPEPLDPLYAGIEQALRRYKAPYYFRAAAERAERLRQRGRDADGIVPTLAQLSAIKAASVVTLVLEHEHRLGYHVAGVSVRVANIVAQTDPGPVYKGVVESCESWAGPYTLQPGDEVLFLSAHVRGEVK